MHKKAQSAAQKQLSDVLQRFEQLREQICVDGIWQCETGAMIAAILCDQANLACWLRFGIYQHPDPTSYIRATGEKTAEPDKEYHYWVEIVDAALPAPLLLDPNGEMRGEPLIQLLDATKRYQAMDPHDPDAIDPVEPDYDPRYDLAASDWGTQLSKALAALN